MATSPIPKTTQLPDYLNQARPFPAFPRPVNPGAVANPFMNPVPGTKDSAPSFWAWLNKMKSYQALMGRPILRTPY